MEPLVSTEMGIMEMCKSDFSPFLALFLSAPKEKIEVWSLQNINKSQETVFK